MVEILKNILLNSKGFKSKRKILVIESDDWGSVRMPSKHAYNNLLKAGIKVDQCGYTTFDSLESEQDLEAIFSQLHKIKDKKGNSPSITANTIVANPDYQKIREGNFDRYYFETFDQSYQRYQGTANTLEVIKQGIGEKLYFPQLHGREHIFLKNWMSALKNEEAATRLAFDNQVYGLSTTITTAKRKSFLTALDADHLEELAVHEAILTQAQQIFTDKFGFPSTSFIAANYTWHPNHEVFLNRIGVNTIQGGRAQKVPGSHQGYQIIKHYMGNQNVLGQIYLIRNAGFEPATRPNVNWHQKILNEVRAAFLVGAPVILSTHRVNFMGGMVEKNREDNLKLFSEILTDLVKKYPDIEFMNTVELSNLIRISKNEL
ncbi:hypothetical protein WMW71_07935 [Flavobacterium buctense]|uniref:Polysaccharide (De)acetylase n=1 Tax=Flavobacterium buctense TaxID=1648146 RepID=A0ABU9E0S6_9FLAO|nr:hypothetical protein [Flavobacterium buctense]